MCFAACSPTKHFLVRYAPKKLLLPLGLGKSWCRRSQHHRRHNRRYRQRQDHAPQQPATRHRLLLSHNLPPFSIDGFALHQEPGSKRERAHWQKDRFLVGQYAYYYIGLLPIDRL